MLFQRLLVPPLVKLAAGVEEQSPDHGIRQASERRTIDEDRFLICSLISLLLLRSLETIHYLKILLFTESDDRSQNAGKAKGRTFLTDLIVNLVNFFPEFSKAFCFLA